MITNYAIYEEFQNSTKLDLFGKGMSLSSFRDLAVTDNIRDIDYNMVNKIALYVHNFYSLFRTNDFLDFP